MAEDGTVVTAPPGEPPVTGTPGKLAGKFENIEALEKGYRELRSHAKLSEIKDKPLFGKGGVFTDAVALEQGYRDLEVMATRPPKVEPKATPAPTTADGLTVTPTDTTTTAISEKGVEKVLKLAGLSGQGQALADQWKQTGTLTDDQYKAFEKAGRDREEVDAFFVGQAAIANQREQAVAGAVSEAVTVAGSQERLDMLRTWAGNAANFDKTILASLNRAVQDNPKFYPTMIATIASEYAKKNGTDGSRPLINGTVAPSSNSTAFSTRAEWSAARDRVLKGTASDLDKSRILATPMSGPGR